MKKEVFIWIFVIILLSSFAAADPWVKDHNNCPQSYQSQNCAPDLVCGYTGGVTYCDDPATVNAGIGGTTTTETAIYNSSLSGGYVLDCTRSGTSCLPWVCQRDSSCYNVNRITECDGGATTFSCSTCRSGYTYCDGSYTDGDGCEIDYGQGTSDCIGSDAGDNNYLTAGCVCTCDVTGGYTWLACNNGGVKNDTDGCEVHSNDDSYPYPGVANARYDGDCGSWECQTNNYNHDGSGANGCEITLNEACTVYANGGSGTCGSAAGDTGYDVDLNNCTCTQAPPVDFQTGVLAAYTTSSPLLYGWQKGTGFMARLNSSNGEFIIGNDGSVNITTNDPGVSLRIDSDDSIVLPVGDTGSRPSGEAGMMRYNSQLGTFEGYASGAWGSLGGVKDADGDSWIEAESYATADNDTLMFYTLDNRRMVIDPNGWVGIGIDSPTQLLTVDGDANVTGSFYGSVSDKNTPAENLIRNGDFEDGLVNWGGLTGGNIATTDPKSGRYHLSKTNTGSTPITQDYIPIDTAKTYKLEAWVKQPVNGGTFYFGTRCYDKDKNTLDPHPGSYDYWGALAVDIGSGWTHVTGYRSGEDASDSNYYAFEPGTKFCRVMMLTNYNNGGGTTYVDDIRLTEVGYNRERIMIGETNDGMSDGNIILASATGTAVTSQTLTVGLGGADPTLTPSTGTLIFDSDANVTGSFYAGTGSTVFEVDDVTNSVNIMGGSSGDGTGSGFTVDSSGNVYFDGTLSFPGEVYVVNWQEHNGTLLPYSDNVFDLGSGAKRWNNIYLEGGLYDDTGSDNFFENTGNGAGKTVTGITSEGGLQFTDISIGSGQVTDVWVNENGDTMSGDLNMGGNYIQDLGYVFRNEGGYVARFDSQEGDITLPESNGGSDGRYYWETDGTTARYYENTAGVLVHKFSFKFNLDDSMNPLAGFASDTTTAWGTGNGYAIYFEPTTDDLRLYSKCTGTWTNEQTVNIGSGVVGLNEWHDAEIRVYSAGDPVIEVFIDGNLELDFNAAELCGGGGSRRSGYFSLGTGADNARSFKNVYSYHVGENMKLTGGLTANSLACISGECVPGSIVNESTLTCSEITGSAALCDGGDAVDDTVAWSEISGITDSSGDCDAANNVCGVGHTHSQYANLSYIKVTDTRNSGDVIPDNFGSKMIQASFTDEITGSPNTWDSVITVKGWTDGYGVWQLLSSSSNGVADDNLYFRSGEDSAWGSLRKVWDSGNDGASSGLNADLLDGISSGGFVRGDGTNNGATTINVENSDFIIQDADDTTTNYIWRDHSASILYLGTDFAVPTLRANLNANSENINNVNQLEINNGAQVEIDANGNGAFNLYADGSVYIDIDDNADGTEYFYLRNGANTNIFTVSETGTATFGGNINLQSNWLSGDGGNYGLTADGSGNVGINTVPSTQLHVSSIAGTSSVVYIDPAVWSSGSYGEIRFGDANHNIKGTWGVGLTFNTVNAFQFSGGDVTIDNDLGVGGAPTLGRIHATISGGVPIVAQQTNPANTDTLHLLHPDTSLRFVVDSSDHAEIGLEDESTGSIYWNALDFYPTKNNIATGGDAVSTSQLFVSTDEDTNGLYAENTLSTTAYGVRGGANSAGATSLGHKYGGNFVARVNSASSYYAFGVLAEGDANNHPSGTAAVGYGGFFIGSGDGDAYGVQGRADSDNGVAYGVYGSTLGGGTNWAGYFAGNMMTTGNIEVGTEDSGTSYLTLSGAGSGDEGGELLIDMSAAHDTTYNSWFIDVFEDDLRFGPTGVERVRFTQEGHMQFSIANPYISSTSYVVMPGGLYVSGGTFYAQNEMKARNGIANDQATYGGAVGINDDMEIEGNLEVEGALDFNSAGETAYIYVGDTSKYIKAEFGGDFEIRSNDAMVINTTGNSHVLKIHANSGLIEMTEGYNNRVTLRLRDGQEGWTNGALGYIFADHNSGSEGGTDGRGELRIGIEGHDHSGHDSTKITFYTSPDDGARSDVERMKISANGNVYVGGGLVHSSDIRLKTNITTIPNALEKTLSLRGVNFMWKNKTIMDDSLQMGLIAQEAELVVPEIVETNDATGMKYIEYDKTVALLVESIKEQQQQINTLKQLACSDHPEAEICA